MNVVLELVGPREPKILVKYLSGTVCLHVTG
jgi:hypothetical protein